MPKRSSRRIPWSSPSVARPMIRSRASSKVRSRSSRSSVTRTRRAGSTTPSSTARAWRERSDDTAGSAHDLRWSILWGHRKPETMHRGEDAMARVTGLGHVGIYVQDLERMVAFYRDVMGMQVTKQNWRAGVVFLSAHPQRVDHEIALMRGRPNAE